MNHATYSESPTSIDVVSRPTSDPATASVQPHLTFPRNFLAAGIGGRQLHPQRLDHRWANSSQ